MKPELAIAIVSGLLTLVASYLVAMYQARTELKKMVRQLQQQYTTSLFDRRLDVYPLLYRLTQGLNNQIDYRTQTRQGLVELQQQYDDWLAVHAILLTPALGELAWGYHAYLIEILGQDSISDPVWRESYTIQATLGKCLRAELGVYDTAAAGLPELEKPHVKAVMERLRQSVERLRGG